jgi:hypothetical protein
MILLTACGVPLPVGAQQSKSPAVPRQNTVSWQTYTNARFGYTVRYPASLLKPQGESDNGDGQKFLSRDGKTRLLVYGSHNVLGETIASRFAEDRRGEKNNAGRKVTYARQKNDWYVVSGVQDGKNFYRKCYLRGGDFVTWEITYPVTERAVWDRLTARVGAEFAPRSLGGRSDMR